MRKLVISTVVAAQIALAAQPVAGAELVDDRSSIGQQRGAFAGARLRVPLGGDESEKPRAGLAVAPVSRTQLADGSVRTRFGEGAELSFGAGETAELRIAGAPLAQRLGAQDHENQEREDRTGKKILKGAAVVAIVAAAVVGGLFLFITVACDGNRCSE